jgi:hypothetical protein
MNAKRRGKPRDGRKRAAALADDVTAEELAARPEQPRAPRSKSTEEAYASSANKWWPMFLKAVCWDGTEKGVFIDAAGDPIDGTFSQLFIWLYEQDGMTKSIYKAMLAWAQARLNKQRAERLLAPMPGYVCNLPGIKERKSELFTGARESHMEHTGAVEPDAAEAAGLGMSPIAARLEHGDFAQAGPSRCQDRGTPRHHQPGWPSHSRAGSDAAAFSRAQTEAEDHRGERGCTGGEARPGGHPHVRARAKQGDGRAPLGGVHDGLERWTCRSQPDSRLWQEVAPAWGCKPPALEVALVCV